MKHENMYIKSISWIEVVSELKSAHLESIRNRIAAECKIGHSGEAISTFVTFQNKFNFKKIITSYSVNCSKRTIKKPIVSFETLPSPTGIAAIAEGRNKFSPDLTFVRFKTSRLNLLISLMSRITNDNVVLKQLV